MNTVVAGETLLEARGLTKNFRVRRGAFRTGTVSAVDDVTLAVPAGSVVGMVGESGSGKSTIARLLLGLARPDAGEVRYRGATMPTRPEPALRREMQLVFQDPRSALNPRMTIGANVGFPLSVQGIGRGEVRSRSLALLDQVGLRADHADARPHQLSGGQLQRANIARALAVSPRLLVCDEPLSALDKSVQAQVLTLLQDLQAQLGLTVLFISHDLTVVQYLSDHVLVVYLGRIVESCPAADLTGAALHPYTRALLAAVPSGDPDDRGRPVEVTGEQPSPLDPPSGCRFRTRCPFATAQCAAEQPPLIETSPGHRVACHLYSQENP